MSASRRELNMTNQTSASTKAEYVLGSTVAEAQRLRTQAQLVDEFAHKLLQQIGLSEGMSCLDVGCGAGDIMRFIGQIVGNKGKVTGLDVNGELGQRMIDLLNATGLSTFQFIEGDVNHIDTMPLNHYDVTFARFLLLHLTDPVLALKKMWEWTKPGGYLVVIDYDFQSQSTYPDFEPVNEFNRIIFEVFTKTGKDPLIGRKLPAHLEAACGTGPDHADAWTVLMPLSQVKDLLVATYKSLVPAAVKLGVTTNEQALPQIDKLSQASGSSPYFLGALVIGAYKRK